MEAVSYTHLEDVYKRQVYDCDIETVPKLSWYSSKCPRQVGQKKTYWSISLKV